MDSSSDPNGPREDDNFAAYQPSLLPDKQTTRKLVRSYPETIEKQSIQEILRY